MKLLFVFIFSLFLFPQHDSEKINWSETRKLTWEDFRGEPLAHAGFVASTNTGISFGYSYTLEGSGANVEFTVESFFQPEKSWFLSGLVSQNVLNHEQTHFDISELHARILRKKMESRKFSKNVKSEIESIYLDVESQRKAMQKKFDLETNHSKNIEKEIFWENHIAKELATYESWK